MNTTNLATQARLKSMMEEVEKNGFKFSPTGMHYLACRVNGTRYKKPIMIGLELMLKRELANTIGKVLLEEARTALGRKTLPDEALIIFATGRKPMLNNAKTHWQEEQSSLLTKTDTSDALLAAFPMEMQAKLRKMYQIREQQSVCCMKIMELLTAKYDEKYPPETQPEKSDPKTKPENTKPVLATVVELPKAKGQRNQTTLNKTKATEIVDDLVYHDPMPEPDSSVMLAMYGVEESAFDDAELPEIPLTVEPVAVATKPVKTKKPGKKIVAK